MFILEIIGITILSILAFLLGIAVLCTPFVGSLLIFCTLNYFNIDYNMYSGFGIFVLHSVFVSYIPGLHNL